MTCDSGWLEQQYWADVIAARPDATIEERIAASRATREDHPAHVDLAYGTHERQQIDVCLPEGDGPWPLLIYIHGGYWQSNHKNDYAFLAPAWLERGVAFATLGYRLLPEVTLVDIVSDIRAAMQYLHNHAGQLSIDRDRVVLSGLSAGAHLTAMYVGAAGTFRPTATVLLSGVYDLAPLESTSPGQSLAASLTAELSDISPLGLGAPGSGSHLIAWGDEETDVFKSQSATLAAYWSNRGLAARQLAVPGANHYTVVEDLRGDSGSEIAEFVMDALHPG